MLLVETYIGKYMGYDFKTILGHIKNIVTIPPIIQSLLSNNYLLLN